MEQPDKLTQTRGSLQIKNSFLRVFYRIFCPCFSNYKDKKHTEDRNNTDYFASDLSNRSSTKQNIKQFQLPRKNSAQFSPYNLSYKIPDPFLDQTGVHGYGDQDPTKKGHKSRSFVDNVGKESKKLRQTSARETVDLRILNHMTYTQKKQWYNFPVYKYRQGQLILLGKNNKNLLAQISTVKLQPSPTSVQKLFLSKQNNTKSQQCKAFDQFWNSRYYYFEKFDQGIQINKETLCNNLTPQAVSDYVAGKCSQCKIVMDAFSGIGHNATKLGTFCEKVLCVEQDYKKYNCLINNIKCYEIQNIELFLKPFLEINLKNRVDAILLHPQILNQNYLLSSMTEVKNFNPNLSDVIKKSLQLSNNIILLLPPNISIKDICYQISKGSQQIQDKIFCSCSVKIQKIFFRSNLMYVAVFFGPSVQQEVKINSELGFIYKMLKNPSDKNFLYKKLLKYLRQKYGMIKLLNFVSQSKSFQRQGLTQIQKFIQYVRGRRLIFEHKLQALLVEQKNTPRRALTKQASSQFDQSTVMSYSPDVRLADPAYTFEDDKQQKIDQQEEQQSGTQRTQSFYSNASGFSAFKKRQTMNITQSGRRTQKGMSSDNNLERQSNSSSIVVKKIMDGEGSLQKQSKSPASPSKRNNTQNMVQSNRFRQTLDIKKIEQQLNYTGKQNLKRTLIEK